MKKLLIVVLLTVPVFADKLSDDAKATRELSKLMEKARRDQLALATFYQGQTVRCAPLVVTIEQGTLTCVAAQQPVNTVQPVTPKPEEKK